MVEFQQSSAVSHISTLSCWCEEKKRQSCLSRLWKNVVTLFNRSGNRWANP